MRNDLANQSVILQFASSKVVTALANFLHPSASMSTTNTPQCQLSQFTGILTNTAANQCSSDASYSFSTFLNPSNDQIRKMCESVACQSVLSAARSMQTTECTLPSGNLLVADLLSRVPSNSNCTVSTNDGSAPSGSNTPTSDGTNSATPGTPNSPTSGGTNLAPSTTNTQASGNANTPSSSPPDTPATDSTSTTTPDANAAAPPAGDTTSTSDQTPTTTGLDSTSPASNSTLSGTSPSPDATPTTPRTSSGSRAASSPVGRALGVMSLGAMAVVAYFV